MKNTKVLKLENIFSKYEEIAQAPKENILQIFIDFIEVNKECLDYTIERGYSAEYILNDYVGSLQYDINNILEIAKEDLYSTQLFKDLLEELKDLRNEQR